MKPYRLSRWERWRWRRQEQRQERNRSRLTMATRRDNAEAIRLAQYAGPTRDVATIATRHFLRGHSGEALLCTECKAG